MYSDCDAGFAIEAGTKILMIEDVVTTGLSSREAIKAIDEEGGEVIAAACSGRPFRGDADLGVPFYPADRAEFPDLRRR